MVDNATISSPVQSSLNLHGLRYHPTDRDLALTYWQYLSRRHEALVVTMGGDPEDYSILRPECAAMDEDDWWSLYDKAEALAGLAIDAFKRDVAPLYSKYWWLSPSPPAYAS